MTTVQTSIIVYFALFIISFLISYYLSVRDNKKIANREEVNTSSKYKIFKKSMIYLNAISFGLFFATALTEFILLKP